jgi:hypothetical protein
VKGRRGKKEKGRKVGRGGEEGWRGHIRSDPL